MRVGAPVRRLEAEPEHRIGDRAVGDRQHRQPAEYRHQPVAPGGNQQADHRQRDVGMLFHAQRPDMVERTGAREQDRRVIVGEGQRGECCLPFEGDEAAGQRHHRDQHVDEQRRIDAREAPLEEFFQRIALDEQDLGHQAAAEHEEELDAEQAEIDAGHREEMADQHQRDRQPAPAVKVGEPRALNPLEHRRSRPPPDRHCLSQLSFLGRRRAAACLRLRGTCPGQPPITSNLLLHCNISLCRCEKCMDDNGLAEVALVLARASRCAGTRSRPRRQWRAGGGRRRAGRSA